MKEEYIVQPLILKGSEEDKALYYRGDGCIRDQGLEIPGGKFASFDTYFNLLPVKQWAGLTDMACVTIAVTVKGGGSVSLFGLNEDGEESLIRRKDFDTAQEQTIRVVVDESIAGLSSFCFLRLEAKKDIMVIGGGLYTDQPADIQPRIACCFCTYKREKEIVENVNRLIRDVAEKKGSILCEHMDVYVSDNGHTLKREDFVPSDRIHLFENLNAGGSAGFARCMMKAKWEKEKGCFTHVLLMDDDAVIQPWVLERTAALLSRLKPEYRKAALGGAMLSLLEPWLQLENGGSWEVSRAAVRGYRQDLRDRRALIQNQRGTVNYNGFFYACFPAEWITEQNLPCPFFIHGDDIDFGLRNRDGWIHMNGISVWHPNPKTNRRPYLIYYDSRNYKIINSGYAPNQKPAQAALREMKKILQLAMQYRYEDALYQIRGTEDYLRGYNFFVHLDPEKHNREVMGWKKYESCQIDVKNRSFAVSVRSGLRTALNWLIPAFGRERFYHQDTGWDQIDLFGIRNCYIVDRKTGEGFVLRKSYRRLFSVLLKGISSSGKLLLRYRKRSEEWRCHIFEMRTLSFWKDYLKLNAGSER